MYPNGIHLCCGYKTPKSNIQQVIYFSLMLRSWADT